MAAFSQNDAIERAITRDALDGREHKHAQQPAIK